ncbi:ferredoxin [Nonomuraea sp. NPDC003804]|uniref:ferredoxin n=1 Tax=Nonomuraea sp. NPDC003804 TaxID=3154547 RepID=UPI0033A63201
MKVKADRDVCIGAGMCVLTAPLVFDQDEEEGLVVLTSAEVPPEAEEAVSRALTLCPSGAITRVDP